MSVMEVAISCGFVSATHFSKCYRDYFGVAPRNDQSSHRVRHLIDPVRQMAAVKSGS
jgi:transcriptional regulator GlxA family with amidase domain